MEHDFNFHLDDHFTIPDSSLSKDDRDTMLGLSPEFKERFQRFQMVYHIRLFSLYRDMVEVGFYSEDAIYGSVRVVQSGDIYYITFLASNYP